MKRIITSIFILLSLAIVIFGTSVFADDENALAGYAWSSNVGWISFNCSNDSSCGTSNYSVVEDDGDLEGYAWSPNIGWIQFGGLAGFPSGSGTQAQNSNINGNNLKGWVKAISAQDGWDGWISLSGAGYGATVSGQTFAGYAWGGDVVGWISFDAAGASGVRYDTPPATFSITGPGTLTLQTLGDNGAESTVGSFFVDNGGTGYNFPVTITVSMSSALPASTTVQYSFDSGASYSSNPSVQISNYATGIGLRVRFNEALPESPIYSVILTGVGTDNSSSTKSVLLDQIEYNPNFQEF